MPRKPKKVLTPQQVWYKADKKANPIKYRLKNLYSTLIRRDKVALTDEFKAWIEAQFHAHLGQSCRYCNEKLTVKTLSCDHRHPLSRGGKNDESNLQFICLSCNFEKGNLTGMEYEVLTDFLNDFTEMRKIIRTRLKMSGVVFAHKKGW